MTSNDFTEKLNQLLLKTQDDIDFLTDCIDCDRMSENLVKAVLRDIVYYQNICESATKSINLYINAIDNIGCLTYMKLFKIREKYLETTTSLYIMKDYVSEVCCRTGVE